MEATISYLLVKTLSLFLYPLSQSLLLGCIALVALLVHWPRTAFWLLLIALAWLYLCSSMFFSSYLMGRLEDPFPPKAMSVTPKVDAIVLLGGAIRGDTHMGSLGDMNQQADRVVHALALYKAGKAPKILITGGGHPGVRSEAEIMFDLLTLMGVPSQAIVLEKESRDTYGNAVLSAKLLKQFGMNKILLVTSAFHMRRAEALFLAQGLEVIPAPTDYQRLVGPVVMPSWVPTVGNLWRTTHAIHEMAGYWVYRYQGRF